MEDIFITNVKVQSVYCIKDAYGTLVWKTRLIKEAYGTLVWKTQVEDSSGRLLSKTPFINIIKDSYGTLMWKTPLEDSS